MNEPNPHLTASMIRLAALRRALADRGLDGFVVPRGDEYQGEYVPPSAERLAWLTGFTGSAGMAVVLADKAALFTDGRYTLQAEVEIDTALFTLCHITEQPPARWIADHLEAGARLGYDPRLHTADGVERLAAACRKAGGELVAVDPNPLDTVWTDRPAPPMAPVVPLPEHFTGRSAAEKRREIADILAAEQQDAAVLTTPESIAWLLNIRGGDLTYAPLPLCFAIVDSGGAVDLFLDRAKIGDGLLSHLGKAVTILPPDGLAAALAALGAKHKRVRVDPAGTAIWFADRLAEAGATVVKGEDPCLMPKAVKTPVELEGFRAAHRRDGAALTRFLAWLAREAPKGGLTELAAADKLESFRVQNEHFRGLSFPTIAGAGPNGAIVHYRAQPSTNRTLAPGQLFLIDSGGQYLDATTDVTRTVALGSAPAEARDRFTRVLKGHIVLGASRFPAGTTGSQLDALARQPLWEAGLDYDHGTGHGVGHYLSVHEGPHRISKMPSTVALKPGMVVSNEPGYYKTGAFGIRIENLVAVRSAALEGAEREMLEFETLTLAPIDRALIDPALLTSAEAAWLDAYHRRVRDTLTPLLDEETAAWLAQVTRPIAEP